MVYGPKQPPIDEETEQTNLWKWGDYFVYNGFHERFGWTFEQFLAKVEAGWKGFDQIA